VKTCDERGVEFFIIADQTERILNEVLDIEEDAWEPFHKGKNQGNKYTKGTGVDSMTAFPSPLRRFAQREAFGLSVAFGSSPLSLRSKRGRRPLCRLRLKLKLRFNGPNHLVFSIQ